MPRATRAAARAGMIHVDDADTGIDQAQAAEFGRPPLEEIQDNDRKLVNALSDLDTEISVKKGKAKSKKTKSRKQGAQKACSDIIPQTVQQGNLGVDVLPTNSGDASSTLEVGDKTSETGADTEYFTTSQTELQVDMCSSKSPACGCQAGHKDENGVSPHRGASENEAPNKAGPSDTVSSPAQQTCPDVDGGARSSSTGSANIVSKAEEGLVQEASIHRNVAQLAAETPLKLSPSQHIKRPEESIEAIDALEDALEEVGKEIHILNGSSHHKNDSSSDSGSKLMPKKPTSPADRRISRQSGQDSRLSVARETTKTRHVKAASTRDTRILNRNSVASVVTRSNAEEAYNKEIEPSKRRPMSLSFPAPAPPHKSNKPVTRPTFRLPGDAVAAKLKVKREERLNREGANEQKKCELKARPVRKTANPAITVKPTATSRARISATHQQLNNAISAGSKRKLSIPSRGPASRPSQTSRPTTSTHRPIPRPSTHSTKSRPSASTSTSTPTPTSTSSSLANTSKSRTSSSTTVATVSATTTSSSTSASTSLTKPPISASELAHQRERARAIFARDRDENAEREVTRRTKEDAARKARAEAAERGRAASRKWAERQRARMPGGRMERNGEGKRGGLGELDGKNEESEEGKKREGGARVEVDEVVSA